MRSRINCSFIILSLLFSCSKENGEIENPFLFFQSDKTKELISQYRDGAVLNYIEFGSSSTYLLFDSGFETTIELKDIIIEDTDANLSRIATVEKNFWYLNKEKTNVPYTPDLSIDESMILYGNFKYPTFTLYFSNGEKGVINYDYLNPLYKTIKGSLPIVKLSTPIGISAVGTKYMENCHIQVLDTNNVYSDVTQMESDMKIKLRGNSTAGLPKHPWHIKLTKSSPVLGMHKNKDWYLLANYSDKTLMRNMVAMEISRICEFPWTPQMRHCEVYANNVYQGVYMLTESHEVAGHRVNIDVDNGDLYLEIDERRDEAEYFVTSLCSVPIMYKDPEHPEIKYKQRCETIIKNLEEALSRADGSAWKYADLKTFVDYYIVQELVKNIDGWCYLSTFMTLPKNGLLCMYHLWDFDLSFGNCNYMGNNGPTGWWIRSKSPWFMRAFRDHVFTAAVKERWNQLKPQFEEIVKYIDQQAAFLEEAQERNFKKWDILNVYVWPNYVCPGTYAGEVAWLKEFYTERLDWLDKEIISLQ